MRKYNKALYHELVSKTQPELLAYMIVQLDKLGYKDIEVHDGFVLAYGTTEIMLCHHADTVHRELPRDIVYEDGKISSPQGIGGDDRNGAYIILETLTDLVDEGIKPYVVIFEDEEIGTVGSEKFVKQFPCNEWDLKFVIECDRRNANDLVFYDATDCREFVEYCEQATGWKEAHGSYSDISVIMDAWNLACVNVSCGYYREHSVFEYTVINEMLGTVDMLVNWLSSIDYTQLKQFVFYPRKQQYSSNWDWLFDSYEEGKDLFPNEDYSPYDEDTEDIIEHEGVSYGVCADCGALVPLTEEALKYGIILCHDCRGYYDDICSSGDRSLYKLF